MSELSAKCDRLLALIRSYESCAVAFSAGVDSTVLAKAAQLALGERAVAITAASPSLPEGELDEARQLAAAIGIRHQIILTEEFSNPAYVRNDPDRCYHCKTELYTRIERMLPELKIAVVLNGANVDDLGDYRPGMRAASEQRVRSPLADCGFTKDEIRRLAMEWQLPIWDKPAMPCLSSRVAYGEEVTPERLAMVDKAERFLRERGWRTVRVRYHKGDLARLEVPATEIPRLAEPALREELVTCLHTLGFRFVTLDLEGFRSGSLNTLVPAEALQNP